jgi:hypothetical protein
VVVFEEMHLFVNGNSFGYYKETIVFIALVEDVNGISLRPGRSRVVGLFVSGGVVLEGGEVVGVDVSVETDREVRSTEDAKGFGRVGCCCQRGLVERDGVPLR